MDCLRYFPILLLLTFSLLNAQTLPPDPDDGIRMWSTNNFGIDSANSAVNLQIPIHSKSRCFITLESAEVFTTLIKLLQLTTNPPLRKEWPGTRNDNARSMAGTVNDPNGNTIYCQDQKHSE
jgi:hypothetical protein